MSPEEKLRCAAASRAGTIRPIRSPYRSEVECRGARQIRTYESRLADSALTPCGRGETDDIMLKVKVEMRPIAALLQSTLS